MKYLTLILLCCCSPNTVLSGQDALELFWQDVVYNIYLEGGEFETGHIIGDTDSVLIIKKLDGTELDIPIDNLKTIRRQRSIKYVYTDNGFAIKRAGGYHTLAYGMGLVKDEEGIRNRGVHISTSHGKIFKKRFGLGLGISADRYNGPNWKKYGFVPIFAEFRASFKHKRTYPFFSFRYGMGLDFDIFSGFKKSDGSYKKGAFTKATVGIVHSSKGWLNVFLEIGYSLQRTELFFEGLNRFGGVEIYEDNYTFRRLNLSVGFLF